MRRHRLIALAVVVTLAATVVGAPAATRRSAHAVASDGGRLLVQPTSGFQPSREPSLDLSLDLPLAGLPPGRIVIEVPRGFQIYPGRPAGSAVGDARVQAANGSYGTPTFSTLAGDIVAQDPGAAAAGCATGVVHGLWSLQLSLLGQPFEVPLLLAAAASDDPAPAVTSIVLCVPPLPTADPGSGRPLPITSLDLSLGGLAPPLRHGSYVWRALVTPLAADGRTLRPDLTYEVRAVVPVPNRVTLAASYDTARRTALLRGRLTANGVPRAGVPIELVRLVRSIRPGGFTIDDSVVGWARTNASGAYAVKTRTLKTSTFVAIVEPSTSRCRGPKVTPAACLSSTLPGTQSEPVTLAVRAP
jgi:hypothetical protein